MAEVKQFVGSVFGEMASETVGVSKPTSFPCMGCDKRHYACHDECQLYQEFKAKRELVSKKRMQANLFNRRIYLASLQKQIKERRRK